tara:strand:- start:3027 stop:5027 length:2001 start_codon:yes stop_codon:yes gene_type:complete
MVKKIRLKAKKDRTEAQTPAPPKDRVKGSKKNPKGAASGSRGGLKIPQKSLKALENYRDEHNEKYSAKSKRVDLGTLKAVYQRGAGAFSSSHRPGASREQWALARVKAFLKLVGTGERKKAYTTDLDLLPQGHPQKSKAEKKAEVLSVPKKYDHIDFTPPKGVQEAAQRALKVRAEKPESQRGMTDVGLTRARDLINGKTLSPDTVRRMLAYFSRHEVDKQGKTWDEKGKGWQAWNGWGGDAGFSWSKKVVKQMNTADNKAKSLRAYSEANLLGEADPIYEVPEGLTIGKPFKTLSLGQVSSRMNGDNIGKEIDQDLLQEMVRVYKERREADPVIIDWQHATSPFQGESPAPPESGNALGLIIDLDLRDDGLYAIPAYNERGLKVVKDAGGILWSSPEYLQGEIFTRDGGEKVGDAQLLAITLTPRPAQQSDKIDRITLKEALMVTESDLKGMSQEDLIDLAMQKDSMVRSLEAKIKEMSQENEAKINKDSESQLEEKEENEEKEELKEEAQKLEEKKEEEEEEKTESNKMSEALPSTQLLSEIQSLREQVQTLQSEKLDAERREAVGSLLREGKISPSEEEAANKAFDFKKKGDGIFWTMFSERPSNSVVPMNQVGHGASGQEITKETINLKIKALSEEKGMSYAQALSEFRQTNTQEFLKAYGV